MYPPIKQYCSIIFYIHVHVYLYVWRLQVNLLYIHVFLKSSFYCTERTIFWCLSYEKKLSSLLVKKLITCYKYHSIQVFICNCHFYCTQEIHSFDGLTIFIKLQGLSFIQIFFNTDADNEQNIFFLQMIKLVQLLKLIKWMPYQVFKQIDKFILI